MAQAGYTPISLYYSTTASAQPTSGNLVAGELALNTLDEKLYFKNSAGTVKLLASSASTTNVQTISFGSTGLTPSTATSGAVTVAGTLAIGNGGTGSTSTTYCSLTTNVTGTLPIGNGGTGQTTASAAFDALNPMTTVGDMIYEGTGPTATRLAIGSTNQVLTVIGGIPSWQTPASGGVTTISFGSTGLTPSTATSGAVSVAGTLAIANGGTGSTSTTYCNLASNVTGTLPVANGGTGATTQTAYAVLAGGTTSTGAYQSIASVGTAGQVLTSNGAGALPSFQAAGGGFPAGTRMSFQQTAAPTGWTKDTTAGLDNSAMRIVTGSVVNGGSVNFTTAFASQTPTGSVSITTVSGSAGATTLTTPQIPSHTHSAGEIAPAAQGGEGSTYYTTPGQTGATGGDGSHTHPFSFSSGSGTFSGNAINLAVKYYDFIIAAKD
jgi:hypothetical protein